MESFRDLNPRGVVKSTDSFLSILFKVTEVSLGYVNVLGRDGLNGVSADPSSCTPFMKTIEGLWNYYSHANGQVMTHGARFLKARLLEIN